MAEYWEFWDFDREKMLDNQAQIEADEQALKEEFKRWRFANSVDQVIQQAYLETINSGGITISLNGEIPTEGYAYSPHKELETTVKLSQFNVDTLTEFVNDHFRILQQDQHYLGLWVEGDLVYMDVSIVEPAGPAALENAMAAQQLAVYDLGANEVIPLANVAP